MAEVRRLSTRNRGEPPLKKRALSPPQPALSAPPPPPVKPVEEGLPVKLKEGRPLPTLPKPQDLNLSTDAYQTISESGVLAASIERSRQRWLTDGPFERYWTKPSKKKDMSNVHNPAKETMTRLGVCSMIVDPHVFEITLYTVKELPMSYTPLPGPLQPPSLSAPQYNPFSSVAPYNPPDYTSPLPPKHPSYQAQQYTHPSQHALPPFQEGFGSFGPQGPPLPMPHAAIARPISAKAENAKQATPRGENGEPDPVIQMLATRAASDPGLKTLMKVVASGKATQQQLKEFQDHIDDLNSILKSRPSPNTSFGSDGASETPQENEREPPVPGFQLFTKPGMPPNQVGPAATHSATNPPPNPIKVEPLAQAYPVATNPSAIKTSSSSKSDIDGICFDFNGTGDRYSLPRFSILEYLYGGTQVIISFIVIRPGNTALSGSYKANKSYYQPVTVRLTSPHPRTLEPLSRAVASPDEVRSYMNNFFDRLSPAETVALAIRLPRATDAENAEKQEMSAQLDTNPTRPVYSPPSSIMPLVA